MKRYPLFLESYFLDFSYGNELHLQNRFFFTIPYINHSINDEDSHFSTITFGFEMNSQYQKDTGNIFYFVEYNEINSNYKDYSHHFDKPNILKIKDYTSSEELYLNMQTAIDLYLDQHKEQFLLFANDLLTKYPILNIKEKTDNLNQQVSRFISEVSHFLIDIKDNSFIDKHHVTFVITTLNSEDCQALNRFKEIQTYLNFLDLSNILKNDNILENDTHLVQKKNKI